MRPGLNPREDADLRRLNFLTRFGWLTRSFRERRIDLRTRDRRERVRPPNETFNPPDQR
jgi:hypothetical protein